MHEDAALLMPPETGMSDGRDTIVGFWVEGGFGDPDFGDFRLRRSPRQPRTRGRQLRPQAGQNEFAPFALDVLRIEDGALTDIIAFSGTALDPFGLPRTLPV